MRAECVTISSSADPLDRRAAGRKLFLQPFEAAVEVIDPVDNGLALSRQGGDHERHGRPQVCRHDRGALEAINSFDGCGLAVEMNMGTEPYQLLDVHEAVFKYGFRDEREPARA